MGNSIIIVGLCHEIRRLAHRKDSILHGHSQTGVLDQDSWNTISRLYTLFVTYSQA